MSLKFFTSLILVFIAIVTFVRACEEDQMHHAWRIVNAQCNYGYGCMSEYRYLNQEDCKEALRGNKNNCSGKNLCMNEGGCLQISTPPGYKCHCQNTGFYGKKCEKVCPDKRGQTDYPTDCIQI